MSSIPIAFTEAAIRDIPEPESGTIIYVDRDNQDARTVSAVLGLKLRVSASGVKVFFLYRKIEGKPTRFTIGRWPTVTGATARTIAREKNQSIAGGLNPNVQKRKARAAGITFCEAYAAYLKHKTLADSTRANYAAAVQKYLADWLGRGMTSITRSMVQARFAEITQGTMKPLAGFTADQYRPSQESANKSLRIVRAVFNFSIVEYDDGDGSANRDNPCIRPTGSRCRSLCSQEAGREDHTGVTGSQPSQIRATSKSAAWSRRHGLNAEAVMPALAACACCGRSVRTPAAI